MEINRAGMIAPASSNTRNSEQSATEQLRAAKVEPENPAVSGNITFSEDNGLMNEEEIARFTKELNDELKQQVKDFERAQSALVSSLDLFGQFKEIQKVANPHLNLDSVDLAQNEDGSLALVGGSMSRAQRSELEELLNLNDALKEAFTEVHKGILSVFQFHTSDFDVLREEDLRGTLKLNEMTEKYTRRFTGGIGQSLPTDEEKIMADPLLFFGMMVDALKPRVSIKV
ncbi:hypothetical protein [Pseudoalteromonas rubra]|uniref:Uncharacterized protein n=1 Tax=Pseudoalteromonas rubra TaxID=43658 RepID=A0A0F4QHF0_9GAMM|nr:hypothetical protein [Pseudoalteromonas rubra]KJZ06082.1 hypothetical protein TW77_20410 [Pseudoalteromonas rubra]